MALPVINIKETDRLSKAMRSGRSFYIADEKEKLLVPVPAPAVVEDDELNDELKGFDKDYLIAALEEAEKCTKYYSAEEHWARMDKIING